MEDKELLGKGISFNLTPDANGNYPTLPDIVVRTGKAEELLTNHRKKVVIKALLGAISIYADRNGIADAPKDNAPAIVMYSKDPENLYVTFQANPGDALAMEIETGLEENQDLLDFGINTGRKFDQKTLEQFIRTHAHCFGNPKQPAELIKSLQNFEIKFEQEVKKGDDRQGNKQNVFNESLRFAQGELPKSLNIKSSFYKGQPIQEFPLEIEIDKGRDNMPEFSFYSMEMEQLKRDQAEKLVNDEVAKLELKYLCLAEMK